MKHLLPIAAMSLLTLAGCTNTSPYSGDVYSSNQVKSGQSVTYGTLVAVRPVQIQADSRTGNLLGGGTGALIGGVLGHQVGGGSGKKIATAAGAIGGAMAGSSVEDRANMVNAVELEVRTDAGEDIVVVQKADRQFQAGDKVRLIGTGSNVSVAPY
ncbi:MAG: glycine zipper 2TM domain-containing protein [Halomonas subglaciescola]|nr:glycine zipper 2TM domain-containing protein [Halomonas subglaciescola]